MLQFASSVVPPVTEVAVPGDANRKYRRSSDPARLSSAALVHWISDFHAIGFSLDGAIQASDFGIAHDGCLRGEQQLLQKVKKVSGDRRKKDMKSVGLIIQSAIYDSVRPNADVRDLLFLLRHFKERYYPLIRHHICHESENTKSAIFTRMFTRLMVIRYLNATKYGSIVSKLPYADDWFDRVMGNIHLHAMVRSRPVPRAMMGVLGAETTAFLSTAVCPQGVEGLLEMRYNSHECLERDHSIDHGTQEAKLSAAISVLQLLQPEGQSLGALTPDRAENVGKAIEEALQVRYSSVEAAKAAAVAAGTAIAKYTGKASQKQMARAQKSGQKAGKDVESQIPAQVFPRQMFAAYQVDHMFSVSVPKLLLSLQKAMFKEGELSNALLDDESRSVRLLR